MGQILPKGTGGGGGGDTSTTTFTTDGSGEATVAGAIGKTVYLYEYDPDGAGTLLGTNLYSFNSGTGAFTGLGASTQYLVIYTI